MRHRKRTFKLGRRPEHVRSMLANQVCSLIKEERIMTTVVKAKETKRLAEKMVTLGKKGTLEHRRRAIAILGHADAVHKGETVGKLFSEIADRYRERAGGYTRIIRLGTRRGDAAEMCYLEWVEAGSAGGPTKKRRGSKKKAAAKADAPAATETVEAEEAEASAEGSEAEKA